MSNKVNVISDVLVNSILINTQDSDLLDLNCITGSQFDKFFELESAETPQQNQPQQNPPPVIETTQHPILIESDEDFERSTVPKTKLKRLRKSSPSKPSKRQRKHPTPTTCSSTNIPSTAWSSSTARISATTIGTSTAEEVHSAGCPKPLPCLTATVATRTTTSPEQPTSEAERQISVLMEVQDKMNGINTYLREEAISLQNRDEEYQAKLVIHEGIKERLRQMQVDLERDAVALRELKRGVDVDKNNYTNLKDRIKVARDNILSFF